LRLFSTLSPTLDSMSIPGLDPHPFIPWLWSTSFVGLTISLDASVGERENLQCRNAAVLCIKRKPSHVLSASTVIIPQDTSISPLS
jgi:hypothetical protein